MEMLLGCQKGLSDYLLGCYQILQDTIGFHSVTIEQTVQKYANLSKIKMLYFSF